MGRPKSAYRAATTGGNEYGIIVTDLDRERLGHLARWYSLSADHLARFETPEQHWRRDLTGLPAGQYTPEFEKARLAVRQRLRKLAAVRESTRNEVGPLVGKSRSLGEATAWFCTAYGVTAANLPWRVRSAINPSFADHAWMAADVGKQIEAMGYLVYSEREIATGVDQHGDLITTNLDSHYLTKSGTKRGKKPDVAVVSRTTSRYIAVEVERDRDRAISTYAEKLRAYDDNPAVAAVWYVCTSEATANRVATAAEQVFGQRDYPLKIVVVPGDADRWFGIPNLATNASMTDQLKALA